MATQDQSRPAGEERLRKAASKPAVPSVDQVAARSLLEDHIRENDDGLAEDEADRISSFVDEFVNQALPTPPEHPEWHYFWATTTNPRDPIAARLRLGYVFVTSEELPEFKHLTLLTGEQSGCIGVNEMRLMKIPRRIWLRLMTVLHHKMPDDEEEKVRQVIEQAKNSARDRRGRPLVHVEPGFDNVGESRRKPSFA